MHGEIDKHINELVKTKMCIDLFGKVNLNPTSFRSWNFTSEVLFCRNTDIGSGKQQLVPSKPEIVFKAANNRVKRFF